MKRISIVLIIILLSFTSTKTGYSAEVRLSWDANTETNLAGYKIHYGLLGSCGSATPGNNFTEVVDVGNVTTYLITALNNDTYNFAITAYDADGKESVFSYIIVASIKISQVKSLSLMVVK